MSFKVLLTEDAARDLEDLYDYIALHDAQEKADYILDQIEELCGNLAAFPERGNHPQELLTLGIRDYREMFFKPYRVIYRILEKSVYIYLIVDGRRDMQALLQRRLLGA